MNNAELTILSLVAEGITDGDGLQNVIKERGLREWLAIGFSSVYYILNKLERQNLLISRLQMESGNIAHKSYEITDAGRGVLQTAVSDLLRQPRSLGTGFELGLANLYALKPQQVYSVLFHNYKDLEQRLEAAKTSWESHLKNDKAHVTEHVSALYTHSIALMQSELEWMRNFLEDWSKRYPVVVKPNPEEDDAADVTLMHSHKSLDPAQVIRRLKRPQPPAEEEAGS
jgi:DNA-binding PadR family transcriptional regulator